LLLPCSRATAGETTVTARAPKAETHLDAFTPYVEAGFDELYVANIGPTPST
jgi:hypothetical protein